MLRTKDVAPLLPPLDRDTRCVVCDSGTWHSEGACGNAVRLDSECRSALRGHCAMRYRGRRRRTTLPRLSPCTLHCGSTKPSDRAAIVGANLGRYVFE